jgi:hypothetical protein
VNNKVENNFEIEERFLAAQADTFAGANVKEKASACSGRNPAPLGMTVKAEWRT